MRDVDNGSKDIHLQSSKENAQLVATHGLNNYLVNRLPSLSSPPLLSSLLLSTPHLASHTEPLPFYRTTKTPTSKHLLIATNTTQNLWRSNRRALPTSHRLIEPIRPKEATVIKPLAHTHADGRKWQLGGVVVDVNWGL